MYSKKSMICLISNAIKALLFNLKCNTNFKQNIIFSFDKIKLQQTINVIIILK